MVNTGGILPLDVYHGSPYTFPPTPRNPLGEFDASKIGTGEGAQAYGSGIYVAEAPAVAKGYQKSTGLVNPLFTIGDIQISPISNPITPFEKTKNYLYDSAVTNIVEGNKRLTAKQLLNESFYNANYKFTGDELNAVKNEISKLIESKGKKIIQIPKGNLYKVDLPDEKIAKMLDFDKHLSEQSKVVQDILLPYQKEIGGSFGTGDQTLKAIAFERRMKGLDDSPAAVAQQLKEMGIPGIRYLDEGSRSAGKGTSNFVVFPGEEKSMTILERNAKKP
jgi:hypothetical protein